MSSKQIGTGLVIKPAPKFADYVVVRDTWKEKDSTEHENTSDGDSALANVTFFNPGIDATCDLVIKATKAPLVKGDTLEESAPGTRVWTVMEVDTAGFGAVPVKQSVQLMFKEDFTPTVYVPA